MDLAEIVKDLTQMPDENIVVGFETSDDAGVFRLSDDLNLIQTADFITPVTDDPFLFGKVAAANSLSDIYAMGGRPLTALNLCCFPSRGIDKKFLAEILKGGLEALTEAKAVLLGGHTVKDDELKYGLAVTGIAKTSEIKKNSSAQVGDRIILTKLIGTGVIIHGKKLGLITDEIVRRACLNMTRLNDVASGLMVQYNASAATDISGFGLAQHVWEVVRASKIGIRLYAGEVPHYPESLEMIAKGVKMGMTESNQQAVGDNIQFENGIPAEMRELFFDPQTSGGLLISIASERAESLLAALYQNNVKEAKIIGEVFASEKPKIEVVKGN